MLHDLSPSYNSWRKRTINKNQIKINNAMKKLIGNRILKLAPPKIGSIIKTVVVESVVSRVL